MDPRSSYERRDDLQFLDVREVEEWAAGRIAGAVHIPLSQLPARLVELDPDRPVITVCRSGHRSSEAAQYLRMAGLNVHNMDGGMKRWAREGLPFSAPNGHPGRVA